MGLLTATSKTVEASARTAECTSSSTKNEKHNSLFMSKTPIIVMGKDTRLASPKYSIPTPGGRLLRWFKFDQIGECLTAREQSRFSMLQITA